MKTFITIIIVSFFSLSAFAETKEELIEKVIVLSNAELDFAEALDQTLINLENALTGDNTQELLKVAKEYCRTNSIKPIYAVALNDTYTEDELKLLIEYYETITPKYGELLRKHGVTFRVNYGAEMIVWRQGLFDVLNATATDQKESKKDPNQQVDPIVKTHVDKVEAQSTQGHP